LPGRDLQQDFAGAIEQCLYNPLLSEQHLRHELRSRRERFPKQRKREKEGTHARAVEARADTGSDEPIPKFEKHGMKVINGSSEAKVETEAENSEMKSSWRSCSKMKGRKAEECSHSRKPGCANSLLEAAQSKRVPRIYFFRYSERTQTKQNRTIEPDFPDFAPI
jgi:hypothetical protein